MGQIEGLSFLFVPWFQDGRILAWKSGSMGSSFEPATSLIGHQRAVVSLVSAAGRLYSGSMDNAIRVIVYDLLSIMPYSFFGKLIIFEFDEYRPVNVSFM